MLYTKSMEKNLKDDKENIIIIDEEKQKQIDDLEDRKIMENEDMLNSITLALQMGGNDDENDAEFDIILQEFDF